MARRPPVSKYFARKVTFQGMKFDSQGELNRWLELQAREQAGEISGLERQVRLTLQPKFEDNEGKHEQAITYIADFSYYENGVRVFEDFKGYQTSESRLKMKLLKFLVRDKPEIAVRLSGRQADARRATMTGKNKKSRAR